jgi:hypothetical protein
VAKTPKSFQETIAELWELLKGYAQQETVEPLRHLGRRIGFGVAGSLSFSLGWFFVTLAIMRFLQTHTLPLAGDWFRVHDWSVYGVALVLLALGVYGALRKILHPDPDLAVAVRPAAGSPGPKGRRDDR